MALLKIVDPHNGRLIQEIEVNSATSMGYAALHVAEALDLDPLAGEYRLGIYPNGAWVDERAVASEYSNRELILCLKS